MNYPLPDQVSHALALTEQQRVTHPGLLLDRLAGYPDLQFGDGSQEKFVRPHLARVLEASGSQDIGRIDVDADWKSIVKALPNHKLEWTQKTVWRLASHLSGSSVVENGSVCLHPIYGFPYLPGQGLKGLAHAFAVLSGVMDADRARVLGCGPRGLDDGPDPDGTLTGGTEDAGSVIFMESWPTYWVTLELDIVNNHHPEYYREEGKNKPPGDWESPIPVCFLAVPANTTFQFAVAARSAATPQADVALAACWLQSGLEQLGAGAKTAAGYGYFAPPS